MARHRRERETRLSSRTYAIYPALLSPSFSPIPIPKRSVYQAFDDAQYPYFFHTRSVDCRGSHMPSRRTRKV